MEKMKARKAKSSLLNSILGSLSTLCHKNYSIRSPKEALDLYLQKHPENKDVIAENIGFFTTKLLRKIKREQLSRH